MMRNGLFGGRQWRLLAALCCATLSSGGAVADDDKAIGKQAFEKACIACHSEPAVPRALPRDQLGKLMSVVSCLGSRPQRLLETAAPSPGEARKLLLALGIVQTPHLIIMDEPTNHLDLPSIQCLEEALAQCPCGVLLVSHDLPFLGRLARTRWQLEEQAEGEWVLQVGEMPARHF